MNPTSTDISAAADDNGAFDTPNNPFGSLSRPAPLTLIFQDSNMYPQGSQRCETLRYCGETAQETLLVTHILLLSTTDTNRSFRHLASGLQEINRGRSQLYYNPTGRVLWKWMHRQ
jgi:hypothetical protein